MVISGVSRFLPIIYYGLRASDALRTQAQFFPYPIKKEAPIRLSVVKRMHDRDPPPPCLGRSYISPLWSIRGRNSIHQPWPLCSREPSSNSIHGSERASASSAGNIWMQCLESWKTRNLRRSQKSRPTFALKGLSETQSYPIIYLHEEMV